MKYIFIKVWGQRVQQISFHKVNPQNHLTVQYNFVFQGRQDHTSQKAPKGVMGWIFPLTVQ